MARHVIIAESSWIWADARSSLHPIHVETPGVEGELEVEGTGAEVRLGLPTRITLEVERLRSHNALVDAELRRRLDARTHPRIRAELQEATPLGPGRLRLRGELTLHGVTRTMSVDVSVRAEGDGLVRLEGEKQLDMREFGLTPPRFLLWKVEPFVRVRALLVARREG